MTLVREMETERGEKPGRGDVSKEQGDGKRKSKKRYRKMK